MSIIFDVAILVVIAVSVFNGWRLGLVKSVMGFASAILSFFAAVFFTPYLGSYICNHFILRAISGEIAETLTSLLNMVGGTTEALFADIPPELSGIFDRFGVNVESFVSRFTSEAPATETVVGEMADAIASPVAGMVSSAIAFILIFVVVAVLLKIATVVIGLAVELPVLKQFNELFGLIFGVFCALFYAIVLSNVFVFLAGNLAVFDPVSFSADMIEHTFLTRLFSELHLSMLTDILRDGVSKLV